MFKERNRIFSLTLTAAMVALSVVFCRFLGFSATDTPFRFELGFLPVAFVAYMFGPIYSGIAYLLADVIGSFFSGYAPNLWISGCQLLTGIIMGFAFYRKKLSALRIATGFSLIAVFVDFLAKAPIFILLYGYTAEFAFGARAINAFINLPIRAVTFYFLAGALAEPMDNILKKQNKKSFHSYANSFQAVTIPGLERIGELCGLLGNPEDSLKFIHIAGTNGKGSTSAYMACILEDAGHKVGKYISPNLIKVNERISIDGKDIGDEELSALLDRIEPLAKKVEARSGVEPTQFEIWTAAALVYFKEKACDYVVLEVGLGGEFDATNVIKSNELAIITRLGIDHTQYLGNTISDVARAKAGIIKDECHTRTVITVCQESDALDIIKSTAEKHGCKCIVAEPTSLGAEGIYERFYLDGVGELTAGISGYHQIENASLAALAAKTMGIDFEFIKSGIMRAKNPARFELVEDEPTVIFDGGHNENGIEALCLSLERYFGDREKTVLFACMSDKEIAKSLEKLGTGDTQFVFTTVKNNPRTSSAKALAERAESLGIKGKYFEEIGDAYEYAKSLGRLTVICGSLYLYKDFTEYMKGRK